MFGFLILILTGIDRRDELLEAGLFGLAIGLFAAEDIMVRGELFGQLRDIFLVAVYFDFELVFLI